MQNAQKLLLTALIVWKRSSARNNKHCIKVVSRYGDTLHPRFHLSLQVLKNYSSMEDGEGHVSNIIESTYPQHATDIYCQF
jgi:hypothetical protein